MLLLAPPVLLLASQHVRDLRHHLAGTNFAGSLESLELEFIKDIFYFLFWERAYFWLFWVTWGSLALLGALVDSKWWGKVVNVLFFARLGLF